MDVKNKEVKKVIRTNVNSLELAEDLSLYSLIGQQRIVEILRNIVSCHFYNKESQRTPELPSIVLSGSQGLGKKTIGRALINSFCLTDYRECLGRTLGMGGEAFIDFFEGAANSTALTVQTGEALSRMAQETFYKILTVGHISVPDRISGKRVEIEFYQRPLVIFICQHTSTLFPELLQVFDLHLTLTKYTPQEIFLILKQRMKWTGWKYSSDEVLKIVAKSSVGNPGKSMRLLQMAYINSRAKEKEVIEIRDVEEAVGLLGKKAKKE